MNAINQQMPYMMNGMDPAFTMQTLPQSAKSGEPSKFESVLRDRKQGTAGRSEQKEQPEDAQQTEEKPVAGEEEVSEEQYAIAAAMLMQPKPEITYVQTEAAPETAIVEAVVEPETEEHLSAMEILPEQSQQTVEQQPELVQTSGNTPKETAAPVSQTPVSANETASETAPEEKPVEEMVRPVETQESSGEGQTEQRSEVKAEVKPQTQAAQKPEEETEEPIEAEGVWNEPVFGELEAAPVKVAAPEKPVELEAPDAAGQLNETLTDAVENGLEQVQVRLSPEGLGEMRVTITRSESGALSIVLRAADPRATALLQQHATDLQHSMAGSLRGEVEIEVREMPNGQQQQFLNPDGEQQGQQHRHPGQQKQDNDEQKQDIDDFMQKLRLGLTDLSQKV